MANHINHYKSLKKKHKIKKRGNSNLPFNFVRIIFCSLFFIFLLLVFLQWFHFFSLKPFFPRIVLLFAVATVFRISYKNNFFPHFFYFPLLSRHFLNWFVCVLHFHSHLTLRSCHIIYALFSFFCCFLLLFLCVCSMNTVHSSHNRSYGYKRVHVIHVMSLFKTSQLYCTEIDKSWI